MHPVPVRPRNLLPKPVHHKVVPPHLAMPRPLQQLRLETRLPVQPEGVDDAVGLGSQAREAADPLAAVPQCAYSLRLVRTVERGRKEIPCCDKMSSVSIASPSEDTKKSE